MSERSEKERKSRSKSSRHRRSRRSEREERSKKEKDFTEQELYKLAAQSRDRQAIREFEAAVFCHGLTLNGIRRAKRRQDIYFTIKGFLLFVQMLCAMVVAIMAVAVFQHLHTGKESVYFATELFVENLVLFFVLLVILFEHEAFRFITPIVMLTMFMLNVIHIAFYLIFDAVAVQCERMDKFYGSLVCLMKHLPVQHLSIYLATSLALLHFIGFFLGWLLLHYYAGTVIHLIELARQIGFTACVTFFKEAERARKMNRKRKRRRRKSRKSFAPDVNASKLPVGTVILAERSSTYKFKGNVQPRGIVIGSGQETVNDIVNLQAPNKEAVKRETKVVRHVMVDGVREKEKVTTKTNVKEPTTSKKSSSKSKSKSSSKSKSKSSKSTKTGSKEVKKDKKSSSDVKASSERKGKTPKTGDAPGSSHTPTYNVVEEMQPRESSSRSQRSESKKKKRKKRKD